MIKHSPKILASKEKATITKQNNFHGRERKDKVTDTEKDRESIDKVSKPSFMALGNTRMPQHSNQ